MKTGTSGKKEPFHREAGKVQAAVRCFFRTILSSSAGNGGALRETEKRVRIFIRIRVEPWDQTHPESTKLSGCYFLPPKIRRTL